MHKTIATAPLTRTHAIKRQAASDAPPSPHKQAKMSWEARLEQRGFSRQISLEPRFSLQNSQDIYGHIAHASQDHSTESYTSDTGLSTEVYQASQGIDLENSPLSNSEIATQNGWKAILSARENSVPTPVFSEKPLDKTDRVYSPTHFNAPEKATRHRASGYEFDNKACRPKGMEDFINRGRISTDFVSGDYFIVCDGHGASSPSDTENKSFIVARYVANNVPFFLEKFLKATQGDINKSLLRAVNMTDASMNPETGLVDRNGIIGLPESIRCGTTLTVVFIPDTPPGVSKKLHIANVGDTRAVLCSDGEGDQVTIDHDTATVRDADRQGIEKAGLQIKNNRVYAPKYGGLALIPQHGEISGHTGPETDNGNRGGMSSKSDIFEVPASLRKIHISSLPVMA